MKRELREWGWMAVGFSACLLIAGIGAVIWGNHIEHRIDRVVIGRHHDHRELRRVTAELGGARQVQADSKHVEGSELGQPASSAPATDEPPGPAAEHVGAGQGHPGSGEPSKPTPAPAGQPTTAPTAPSPGQTPASSQPTQPVEAEGLPAVEPTPAPNAPGLLGNPGGTVGEVLCSVNALGIRVCTE